jgi:exonuclease III
MDKSNILVWNIISLNDRNKRDNLRIVVDGCRPMLVCIQETKLAAISNWDVASLLGRDFADFISLPAQGTRGGILVAWSRIALKLIWTESPTFNHG